jgi:hypothetical protein
MPSTVEGRAERPAPTRRRIARALGRARIRRAAATDPAAATDRTAATDPATVADRTAVPGRARAVDRRAVARIGVVAAVCCVAGFAVAAFGRPYTFSGLRAYHGAVAWWADGNDFYRYVAPDPVPGFSDPPFAALVLLPTALLPTAVAGWINLLAGVAALTVVLATLLVPVADRRGWSRGFTVALAVPLALATEPVRGTLGHGEAGLLPLALVVADLVALRRRAGRDAGSATTGNGAGTGAAAGDTATGGTGTTGGAVRRFWSSGAWAGAGIGLATALTLTPALFIAYLVVTRRWRAAMTATGTAAAVTAGAFLLAGRESGTYFGDVLWQTDRAGADLTANQSLAGVLARLYDSAETPGLLWVAFSLLVLAVGLCRAAAAHAEGDEVAAFTLVGLTAGVIAPVSWAHHQFFVLPALIVLADAAARRGAASRFPAAARGLSAPPVGAGVRTPAWFPRFTDRWHAGAALGLYLLVVVSPIWFYEHRLPAESHHADGLVGMVVENSLALALIVLVVALPWRPGAEPAYARPPVHVDGRPLAVGFR